MTTIIEIAAIRPPKEGKKKATVVAKDGRSFLMWPDKATKLAIEQAYAIEIEDSEFNGRTYRSIVKATPATAAAAAPANGNARTVPIASEAPDAEQRFVSAMLNAFIAAGKVNLDARELIQATTTLRMLWSASFGTGLNTFRASEAGQTRN
jgi:hypothetical protein